MKPSGAKSWAFIWKESGKRREMGLGAYPAVKLARARALAAEAREAIAEGRDPIAEKRKEEEPTLRRGGRPVPRFQRRGMAKREAPGAMGA